MPLFLFFGGNLLSIAKRDSRLAAQGSGSQARKIVSHLENSALRSSRTSIFYFWASTFFVHTCPKNQLRPYQGKQYSREQAGIQDFFKPHSGLKIWEITDFPLKQSKVFKVWVHTPTKNIGE